MNAIEWRWSTGEEYLKSARKVATPLKDELEINEQNISQTAIVQSLNGFDTTFSRNDNPSGNRREYLDNKISDREMLFQCGTNPFLQTTNYVNDITARDVFMKPKNTTFEKAEDKSYSE